MQSADPVEVLETRVPLSDGMVMSTTIDMLAVMMSATASMNSSMPDPAGMMPPPPDANPQPDDMPLPSTDVPGFIDDLEGVDGSMSLGSWWWSAQWPRAWHDVNVPWDYYGTVELPDPLYGASMTTPADPGFEYLQVVGYASTLWGWSSDEWSQPFGRGWGDFSVDTTDRYVLSTVGIHADGNIEEWFGQFHAREVCNTVENQYDTSLYGTDAGEVVVFMTGFAPGSYEVQIQVETWVSMAGNGAALASSTLKLPNSNGGLTGMTATPPVTKVAPVNQFNTPSLEVTHEHPPQSGVVGTATVIVSGPSEHALVAIWTPSLRATALERSQWQTVDITAALAAITVVRQ